MKVDGYTLALNWWGKYPEIFAYLSRSDTPHYLLYECDEDAFEQANSNIVTFKMSICPLEFEYNKHFYREIMHAENEIRLLGGLNKALYLDANSVEEEAKSLFKGSSLIGVEKIFIRRKFAREIMKSGEIKTYGKKEELE